MLHTQTPDRVDVAIVGGGPGGLAAALMLGRGRKRVLLLDAGTPRNARAHKVQNFVTRDGTPPAEFRRLAHEQLTAYPSVVRENRRVERISGEKDDFTLHFADGGTATARRVLLALGMVDVLPEIPGYPELWGHSLFQCPYCHGWEVQDQRFGFVAPGPDKLDFAIFLKSWSPDVVAFTNGAFEVPSEVRDRLAAAGVPLQERPIRRLAPVEGENRLAAVELEDGTRVERDVLFVRPPQRQTALVEALGLTVDAHGFVQLDMRQETSRPGVFAAGDMATMMQTATGAAAAGQLAASMIHHDLAFAR